MPVARARPNPTSCFVVAKRDLWLHAIDLQAAIEPQT